MAGPTFNTVEFIRPIVSMDFNTLLNENGFIENIGVNINMEMQDQIIINKPILNFLMILLFFFDILINWQIKFKHFYKKLSFKYMISY